MVDLIVKIHFRIGIFVHTEPNKLLPKFFLQSTDFRLYEGYSFMSDTIKKWFQICRALFCPTCQTTVPRSQPSASRPAGRQVLLSWTQLSLMSKTRQKLDRKIRESTRVWQIFNTKQSPCNDQIMWLCWNSVVKTREINLDELIFGEFLSLRTTVSQSLMTLSIGIYDVREEMCATPSSSEANSSPVKIINTLKNVN